MNTPIINGGALRAKKTPSNAPTSSNKSDEQKVDDARRKKLSNFGDLEVKPSPWRQVARTPICAVAMIMINAAPSLNLLALCAI
ncbi:MAG: hypothetical protein FJX48_04645 [Alphaproteobacteria bacterium]|nr:hypothetical protein [Alphaproteobacteria bacterium]